MRPNIEIVKPCVAEVEHYLQLWDTLENYLLQESSLKKLFTQTYPLNNELDDVLIKVCALNDFYSTNIFSPITIAKHIVKLNIDESLANGDLSIVNKIALVKMNGGKVKNFYSFATKFCSHHRPEIYPIYDSYVDKFLIRWKKLDKFAVFTKDDLKNFEQYRLVLNEFRAFYGLESFDLKQIDRYLWQAGKKYFPRRYK